jgi:hypothetical protein
MRHILVQYLISLVHLMWDIQGKQHSTMKRLHDQYGDVVRIAPNAGVVILIGCDYCINTVGSGCIQGRVLDEDFLALLAVLMWDIQGKQHSTMKRLHDQYGDVVRIAPNALVYRAYKAGSLTKTFWPFLR